MNESSFFESLCSEDKVTETNLASALELVSADDLQEIMEKEAGPASALFAGGGALAKGTMLRGAAKGLAASPGRAAIAGGALGAAHGAMTAGTNPQTGQPNSMLGGALKGAIGGAALGAGAGVASRAGLAYAGGGTAGVQKVMGGLGRQIQRGAQNLNNQAGQVLQGAAQKIRPTVPPVT
jgi:hypothetical protein